jgi:hypothetical protein
VLLLDVWRSGMPVDMRLLSRLLIFIVRVTARIRGVGEINIKLAWQPEIPICCTATYAQSLRAPSAFLDVVRPVATENLIRPGAKA